MSRVTRVSFSEAFPDRAKEAFGWDPSGVSFGSAKVFEWICQRGHIWRASPNQRCHAKAGCPYCANRYVWPGFNDLAHLHSEIAAEADGWDPSNVLAGSHEKLGWKCRLGHEWIAQVKSRTGLGTRCPVCANQRVLAGFNDLATHHPQLAEEADGWDPSTIIAGSGKVLPWKCSEDHKWTAALNSRVRGNGCPICSNRALEVGVNDLETAFPEIAAQADGWDPSRVLKGSTQKLSWKCDLGHRWKTSIDHRVNGQGCPFCAFKKVLPGFNDLATWFPDLAKEADGWDPAMELRNSHHVRQWKCPEGHVWQAQIKSRCSGRGCSTCTKFGYKQSEPAHIYLLRHLEWRMLQIGISNDIKRRLREHELRGRCRSAGRSGHCRRTQSASTQ